jgi:hypothetical protein
MKRARHPRAGTIGESFSARTVDESRAFKIALADAEEFG